MAPTDSTNSPTSLQIPSVDSQGSSRHYNAAGSSAHPSVPPSSQVRPISVAAHTAASSQPYNSASTSSRRQRASHNVVTSTSNPPAPERSQSHHDSSIPPYTDVYSHPAAVAYAAAHPRRTIPKFGPYLLLQTLGEGEFGKVKLGLHCQWGEEVAVKLIRRGNVDSSVRMSKIEREIEVLKLLKHPNIVRLYDVIETDKYIGIILEYASGGELFDHILAHRYLRERDAAKLFSQLISGVWYIHQKKIVHRDLKLENLLLDRNRNVIITDFGFANRFEHKADDLMQTSCGSPCYAAPELVISEGLYVGSAVDIWSCGVILYAMLAGYLPFDDDPANPDGDNINLLYKYIVSTPLTFPEYISTEARDLLSTMLVPDPTRRTTLDSIMRHPWLTAYQVLRTDGKPNSFGKAVEELEKAAMDQHNLKRQAYQRQMRAAAAAAATTNVVIPPSRTQSHRPEASAPATTSRSRSTQPEYLYDSSADHPSPVHGISNVNATPTQTGVNKKVYGSPAALGLTEDDPFAGPAGSKNNNLTNPPNEHGTTTGGLSTQQSHGRKSTSSAGGSFRHTIQVEYDDPPKSSRREEKRRERTGSQTQPAVPKSGNPVPPHPISTSPTKDRRHPQTVTKPLPPSPVTVQSPSRGPIPAGFKTSPPPSGNDTTYMNSRPVDIAVNQTTSIGSTPGVSASPSVSASSEQQDSGSQKSAASTKGRHKRGKSSLDRIGLGKIFGSGFGLGSAVPTASPVNGTSSTSRHGSVTPVPSETRTSATSDHLTSDKAPEKKSRRNTLTVMVEPLSRSIRGKKGRMATTPGADGTNSVNGGKISKSSPHPSSAPLSASSNPVQGGTYPASQDTSAMLASTNKAKKVMQWFRTKSKGHDSVGFPIEGATPTQSKYRKGFSASSSTINHSAPSSAPGLAESGMSPQVVVTSPNSGRPVPKLLYTGHPQRSASTATESALATPSFVTRFRNSITANSSTNLQQAEKSNPHGQLRIHHGAVDPTAVTTRPPPEVMTHVRKVLESMGVEIQLESEYKYRCIRAKKRKGPPSVATSSGNVSPSHSGLGLAAVTMVGSAASNGVDKRGLPLPSPSAFANTGGMLRGLLMRRQSSQSNHAHISSPPSIAFDDETSVIVNEPLPSADIAYGDSSQDAGDEVRFSVELTRIDRLNDTYSLDIRRLKGNLRSYKYLYDTLRDRADLSATQA